MLQKFWFPYTVIVSSSDELELLKKFVGFNPNKIRGKIIVDGESNWIKRQDLKFMCRFCCIHFYNVTFDVSLTRGLRKASSKEVLLENCSMKEWLRKLIRGFHVRILHSRTQTLGFEKDRGMLDVLTKTTLNPNVNHLYFKGCTKKKDYIDFIRVHSTQLKIIHADFVLSKEESDSLSSVYECYTSIGFVVGCNQLVLEYCPQSQIILDYNELYIRRIRMGLSLMRSLENIKECKEIFIPETFSLLNSCNVYSIKEYQTHTITIITTSSSNLKTIQLLRKNLHIAFPNCTINLMDNMQNPFQPFLNFEQLP